MDTIDLMTVVHIWGAGVLSVFALYFGTILWATTLQAMKILFYFSTGFKFWRFYFSMLSLAFFKAFFRVLVFWPIDFLRVQDQIPKLYQRTKVSFSISALPLSKKGKKNVALYFHHLGVDQGQMQEILFKLLENSIAKADQKKNQNHKLDALLEIKADQVEIEGVDQKSKMDMTNSKKQGNQDQAIHDWDDFDRRRIAIQKALQQEMIKRGMPVSHVVEEEKVDAKQPQSLDQKKASSLYEKNKKS